MRRLYRVLSVVSLLSLSTSALAAPPPEVEVHPVGAAVAGFSAAGLPARPESLPASLSAPIAPRLSAVTEPPVVVPFDSLEQLVPVLASLAASGQWGALAVALLLGAVLVLLTVSGGRALFARWLPWFATDQAGVLLSALSGALGSLLTSLLSGVPWGVSLVLGFLSSLLASGFHSWRRKAGSTAAPEPYCTPEEVANGKC